MRDVRPHSLADVYVHRPGCGGQTQCHLWAWLKWQQSNITYLECPGLSQAILSAKKELFAVTFSARDRKLKIIAVRCDNTHSFQINQCIFTGNPNHCQKVREGRGRGTVMSAAFCDLCCDYTIFVTYEPQQPTLTVLTSEPVLYPYFQDLEIKNMKLNIHP